MRLHPRAMRLLPLLLFVLLLPPRGEAQGEPGCMPSAVPVSTFADPDFEILELAAADGTLVFIARNGASYELWAHPEGGAPRRLNPADGTWPANVTTVKGLFAMGRRMFFVLQAELNTYLWATDEANTGISPVRAEPFPGATLVDPEFTLLGSWLFFKADDATAGSTLWRTNGTSVELVLDEGGNPLIDPVGLVARGQDLFFGARYGLNENELWISQEAQRSARLVTNLRGPQPSFPSSLTVVGTNVFFTAITSSANAELWVTDGTEGGTEMVAGDGTLGASHGLLEELTAVGGKLFFHMQGETGDELWVSEGLGGRTAIVEEIQEGPFGGNPVGLTAVGNLLFFMANDGEAGREPWRSDGTAEGTFRVEEFVLGSTNPSPSEELKAGPGVLVLSIYGDDSGTELWSISGTGTMQLTEILQGEDSSDPHGMTMMGDKLYFAARARPGDFGQELFVLDLNEVDCNDPSVTCPGPVEVEAVSPMGALVFLPPPEQMSDDSFTPLTVRYSSPSPDIVPLDTPRSVTITVSDMAGRTGTCSFLVTVRDMTGPELVCPDRLAVEAEGMSGANVSFPVVARDAVSGEPSVVFTRASGDTGTHFELSSNPNDEGELVTVTATDTRNNSTSCQFRVAVKDTVPPKLTCPPDIVRVATPEAPAPMTIGYVPPVPEDTVGARLVENTQRPPSGSLFQVGRTDVELEAVDGAGNSSTCTFSVYIVDPVAPTITCPGPQEAVATGPEGAVVDFPEAEAEDEEAPPTISYSVEPGSTFPVGETTVTATAADRGGNKTSCSFTVTVTGLTQPPSGCACGASPSASASVYWLLLALAPLWARRRAGRLAR